MHVTESIVIFFPLRNGQNEVAYSFVNIRNFQFVFLHRIQEISSHKSMEISNSTSNSVRPLFTWAGSNSLCAFYFSTGRAHDGPKFINTITQKIQFSQHLNFSTPSKTKAQNMNREQNTTPKIQMADMKTCVRSTEQNIVIA